MSPFIHERAINDALIAFMERVLARAKEQIPESQYKVVDLTEPQYALLLSDDPAVIATLSAGTYIGLVVGTDIGIDNPDLGSLLITVQKHSDNTVVVTHCWNNQFSKVKTSAQGEASVWFEDVDAAVILPTIEAIQQELITLVSLRNTGIIDPKALTTDNPNKIEAIPTAGAHAEMVKGLTYFLATPAELGVSSALVADVNETCAASVMVLTVPVRRYYYTVHTAAATLQSTVTPSVSLSHSWKVTSGGGDGELDQGAVEALVRALIATDEQAVDATNNTALMSPKAFSIAFSAALSEWIGNAPEALDTLEEIAAVFNNNPDIINTMNGLLATLRTDVNQLRAELDDLKSNPPQGGAIQLVDWNASPWSQIKNWYSGEEMAALAPGFYIGTLTGTVSGMPMGGNPPIPYNPEGVLRLEVLRSPNVGDFTPPGGTWFEFTLHNAGMTLRRTCDSAKPNPYQASWTMMDTTAAAEVRDFELANELKKTLLGGKNGIFDRWANPITPESKVSADPGRTKQTYIEFYNGVWTVGTYDDANTDEPWSAVLDDGQVFVLSSLDNWAGAEGWKYKVTTTSGELETSVKGTVPTSGMDWSMGADFILSVTGDSANLNPSWEGVVQFQNAQGEIFTNTLKIAPKYVVG